jgi:hypothetical protein
VRQTVAEPQRFFRPLPSLKTVAFRLKTFFALTSQHTEPLAHRRARAQSGCWQAVVEIVLTFAPTIDLARSPVEAPREIALTSADRA